MRRDILLLTILVMLSGLGVADNITGRIAAAGEFEVYIETGSKTMAFDRELRQFDQFSVNAFGLKYGINRAWAVALSFSSYSQILIQSIPGEQEQYHSYQGPMILSGEYYTGIFYGLDTKAFVEYDLRGLTETIKGSSVGSATDQSKTVKNYCLGIAASKPGLFDPKLTMGASLALRYTQTGLDSDILERYVDWPKSALLIKLGADYLIDNSVSVYLNLGKVYDSSVIGKYDDDTDSAILVDQTGSVELGLKVLY